MYSAFDFHCHGSGVYGYEIFYGMFKFIPYCETYAMVLVGAFSAKYHICNLLLACLLCGMFVSCVHAIAILLVVMLLCVCVFLV